MLRDNNRQSRSSSIFWPVDDDVDTQSTVSASPVQPVLDAGKLRRHSVQPTRPVVSSDRMLLRRPLESTSSTTLLSASSSARPSKLLPERFDIPQTTCSSGRDYESSHPRPKWIHGDSSSQSEAWKVLSNCGSRSDDGWSSWRQNSDVELCGATLRRSSDLPLPSDSLNKSASAVSLQSSLGRRAWVSKYLQQFAKTTPDDAQQEPPKLRRRGSVAALVDSFERCALLQGISKPAAGRLVRGGSLTNLDSTGGRTRGWWKNFEKEEDDNISDRVVPPSGRSDLSLTTLPALNRQVPGPVSYGNYVKPWKTKDDQATADDEAAHAVRRRSSVDVICKALHGSLTNLDSIGRARTTASNNGRSTRSLTSNTTSPKLLPSTATDHAEVDSRDANRIRRSNSFDVVAPRTLYNSDYAVRFRSRPGPPDEAQQQRRLTVLVGTERMNHCDRGTAYTPLTTNVRGKAYGIFKGAVSQQKANRESSDDAVARFHRYSTENSQKASYDSENGSTSWPPTDASRSLPTPDTQCDNFSRWGEKLVPALGTVDDIGSFESNSWRYYGGTSPRRPRSLMSDSNTTEDSGIALSDYSSPVVDWSRADLQQTAGCWSKCRPKSARPWMTCAADENKNWPTPPSQQNSDTQLTQPRFTMHGKRIYRYFRRSILCFRFSDIVRFGLAPFVFFSIPRIRRSVFVKCNRKLQ